MKILKTYEKFIRKENLNDIYNKYYSKFPFETFQDIVKSDPTSMIDGQLYMGKYCKWLLKLYINRKLKLEDLYKATEYLLLFDKQAVRNKLPLENRNINNFKSLGELAQTISDFKPEDLMSKKEIKEDNLIEEFKNFKLYIPKDHKDSCILGKGTEWCTATEKTDNYFKQYHRPRRELLIFISKTDPKEKYQFHFKTQQFMDRFDDRINIKDFLQKNPDIDSWLKLNVRDYKKIYSFKTDVSWTKSNFDDCPKIIEYDFYCYNNNLTSLEGCPKKVEGSFDCSNNDLTSLENCPEIVEGNFNCINNQLTSLKGCTKEIEGYFSCRNNKLTSLIGGPEVVDYFYFCYNNQLTSLEGSPKNIKDDFKCHDNQLTSLEGGPEIVEGNFNCSNNQLISLKGCPEKIEGDFYCANNQLTSLKGCSEVIEGKFNCANNQLTSLIGCPEKIDGDFYCNKNNLTSLKGCPEIIEGDFYCNDNRLTSLEGCPRIIEGDFDCSNNPRLTDEDFEWLEKNCRIEGEINK
jgi:hypothetical protein